LCHSNTLDLSTISEANINTLLDEYQNLLFHYGARKLSYDADKLPALSGICERLHLLLGGEFLAGLWSVDLLRELMWNGRRDDGAHACAPSWSWAGTSMSTVEFSRDLSAVDRFSRSPLDLRVHGQDIELLNSSNPYGEVLSGRLHVTGYTLPAICFHHSASNDNTLTRAVLGTAFWDREWVQGKSTDMRDGQPISTLKLYSGERTRLDMFTPPSSDGHTALDEQRLSDFSTEYIALLVLLRRGFTGDTCAWGLIIQAATSQRDGDTYERVAMFELTLRADHSGDTNEKWFRAIWQSRTIRLV